MSLSFTATATMADMVPEQHFDVGGEKSEPTVLVRRQRILWAGVVLARAVFN